MKISPPLCLISLLFSTSSFCKLSSETELSLVLTGGNSEIETYNAKTKNEYKFSEKNQVRLSGHYAYGTSAQIESVRNWDGALRYDRNFSPIWSSFLGEQAEGDKFAGIKTRYNTDFGAKNTLYQSQRGSLVFESGYRYVVERKENSLPTEQQQKVRVFTEGKRLINEIIEVKLQIEYLPNLTIGSDWGINIGPSFEISLNKTFSLKLTYKGQYDNLPAAGNRKYDYTYTTGLVAKL